MADDIQLSVERIGGLGGFGLPGSHLKSTGQISLNDLSPDDARKLAALFEVKSSTISQSKVADGFRYRITRKAGDALKTIELSEELTPMVIRNCVKDTLE